MTTFCSILVVLFTIFVVGVITFVNYKTSQKKFKKENLRIRLRNSIVDFLKKPYIQLFGKNQKLNFFMRIVIILFYISAFYFMFSNPSIKSTIILRVILCFFALVFIHFIFYFVIVPLNKISKYFEIVNSDICDNAFLSTLMPMIYVLSLIYNVADVNNPIIFLTIIIGGITSHIYVFKGILKCTLEPMILKNNDPDFKEYNKYYALVSWLIIIMTNLFFDVVFIYKVDPQSFKGVNDFFDLFYFVIITFATVGYGDILPGDIWGKLVSVIIIIGSILFLVIFVGTVLSVNFNTGEKESKNDDVKKKEIPVTEPTQLDEIKNDVNKQRASNDRKKNKTNKRGKDNVYYW